MTVRKKIIYAVLGLIGLLVVRGLFFPVISHPPGHSLTARAYIMEEAIVTGAKAYRMEYDSFPTGSTAQITAALSGNNPRHIFFIDLSPSRVVDGQIIDEWGTPYSITFPTASNVVVRSAGKDKIFGTADDIVSDQYPSP